MRVEKMERHDFTSMSMDELWSLHEQVTSILAHKISTGRDRLSSDCDVDHTMAKQATGAPQPTTCINRDCVKGRPRISRRCVVLASI
jgi:hypothetical protein